MSSWRATAEKWQRLPLTMRSELPLRAGNPIHDDIQGCCCILAADVEEEAFAVAAGVVCHAVCGSILVKEAVQLADGEIRSLFAHVGGIKSVGNIEEEEFLTITAPRGIIATIDGDLPLAALAGGSGHVDLVSAGFVRGIGDPSTIRRKPKMGDVGLWAGRRDQQSGFASIQRLQVNGVAGRPHDRGEEYVFSIRRPRRIGVSHALVFAQQAWFSAAIGGNEVKGRIPQRSGRALRRVSDHLSVGGPCGLELRWSIEGEAGFDLAPGVEDPNVFRWRSVGHGNLFSIRRNSRIHELPALADKAKEFARPVEPLQLGTGIAEPGVISEDIIGGNGEQGSPYGAVILDPIHDGKRVAR